MLPTKYERMEIAKKHMIKWLYHRNELGRKPTKIICTRSFYHEGLKYYIFKFKTHYFDKQWKLAVCGGFNEGQMHHHSHTFSRFNPYDVTTELRDALELVDMVKNYWETYEAKNETQQLTGFFS